MILPDVISRLGTMFTTAVSPVAVFDGPVPPAANKTDFVLVGSTGDDFEDGATVGRVLSDLGDGTWFDESGEVFCSAWSWSGDTNIAARRTAVTTMATACAAAVAADRSLGGLLVAPGLALVSDFRYQPRQSAEGALVRLIFSVTYTHLNTQ